MSEINSLADLNKGEHCEIYQMLTKGDIRRRLQDIGLVEGTRVECVKKVQEEIPKPF